MITKTLVAAAIIFGSLILGAAPSDADPNQQDPAPNPFVGLATVTPQTGPAADDPAFMAEIERGLLAGAAH